MPGADEEVVAVGTSSQGTGSLQGTGGPYVSGLTCRECGRGFEAVAAHVCSFCFGPLEVSYDYEAIASVVTPETIAAGPLTIWRYADLLPVRREAPVDLGAGFTPLVRADRLAAELGLGELWLKNDTVNPTGSFKDRVVSVALTKARELGFKVAACASTGNLANSLAAHAARAGMRSCVFVPANLETAKIVTTAVYGGLLVAVDGNYDQVNRLCAELASEQPDWAFVNVNVRTYYAEGSKTLAFEVAEQLGWQAPDHVVVPIASGSQLTKIAKGFSELAKVGLLPEGTAVRISGAQAAGCSPVATAFEQGHDYVRPVKPDTIAKSLAIGNPADGWYALEAVRSSGGSVTAVSDAEILDAIGLLARCEGIFAETAGGVTIASLAKLAASGVVRPDERVVAYITGNGLKTVEALQGRAHPTVTISPTLGSFNEAIDQEQWAKQERRMT
ncbi:MAG: threonine synthase [Acidimicrobiales bacterium]